MGTTRPLITGVDFVTVPTDRFEASVTFYGETLGLPLTARYGSKPGAEFQAGNLTLAVMESAAFGQTFAAQQLDHRAAGRRCRRGAERSSRRPGSSS